MRLKIEIRMDNAVFDEMNGVEVARILRQFADRIQNESLSIGDGNGLSDINGNNVGKAQVVR